MPSRHIVFLNIIFRSVFFGIRFHCLQIKLKQNVLATYKRAIMRTALKVRYSYDTSKMCPACENVLFKQAQMAELVDAHGSGPCAFGCGGSSPLLGTN